MGIFKCLVFLFFSQDSWIENSTWLFRRWTGGGLEVWVVLVSTEFGVECQVSFELEKKKTYNTRDSLVVTHPTTSLAVAGLSRGERTGSRVFRCLWSYVLVGANSAGHIPESTGLCELVKYGTSTSIIDINLSLTIGLAQPRVSGRRG